MKNFEILLRITKCDTETWTEQMLLEKWCQQTYPKQSCHKLLIKKKKSAVTAKHRKKAQ